MKFHHFDFRELSTDFLVCMINPQKKIIFEYCKVKKKNRQKYDETQQKINTFLLAFVADKNFHWWFKNE